jgi:hypothetical protein
MKKGTVHLGSAHTTARPARPSGPAPLGISARVGWNRGGKNSPRRRWLTGQIRPVGSRWSAGKRPGSNPGRRWSRFGAKSGGRLTVVGSRRRWRLMDGCAGEGGRPAVIGSVGEVGEHLRARAMLLAGSTGPEEHRRRRLIVAGEARKRSQWWASSGAGGPRCELERSAMRGGEGGGSGSHFRRR